MNHRPSSITHQASRIKHQASSITAFCRHRARIVAKRRSCCHDDANIFSDAITPISAASSEFSGVELEALPARPRKGSQNACLKLSWSSKRHPSKWENDLIAHRRPEFCRSHETNARNADVIRFRDFLRSYYNITQVPCGPWWHSCGFGLLMGAS